MRRAALAIVLGAILATTSPVAGRSSEARWIAYVRAGEQGGPGSLIAVRPGGRGERTLLDTGVVGADAGGAGAVFALVRHGDTTELVRVRIGSGAADGPRATGSLSGVAAVHGRVAVERRIASGSDVPKHLREAIDELASASITVLAPPRRPPGTTHTVASAGGRRYELRFTNDPDGVLSHAEQVNVFVGASPRPVAPLPDALPVEVRGTAGSFSCGASACFLDWEEGSSYAVGEFGRPEDAIEFAESLRPMEDLVGPSWREGGAVAAPQLLVLGGPEETVLESVEGFCECSFHPVDWDGAGERLLVVTRAEGFTTVTEYGRPDGPEVLHEAAGRAILDASYTPAGVAMIESPAVGRPGPVRTIDGRTLARRAISFDVEGSTMAVVRGNGNVLVRDLESGAERIVGTGAVSVTVSPGGVAPAPSEEAP
ncbi:MAG TPA: hypothetical protein VF058_08660, partial [Actinomycetota bacterium]